MGRHFSAESFVGVAIVFAGLVVHDWSMLRLMDKKVEAANHAARVIVQAPVPSPTPVEVLLAKPAQKPCKHLTTLVVADFGGCDSAGVCGVEYESGGFGRQAYPVEGKHYKVCVKR